MYFCGMNNIEKYIRDIQDFPKEGILFKDIATLLQDPVGMRLCLENLTQLVGEQKIDKVVGMESRGFFFGTLLAQQYNAGFVPVRKPGKLPFKKIAESYDLEYGQDSLEIHVDAIEKGERVLIHDDVLATGGTAEAVCKLVERLGGEIVQCNFIMQLDFLKGKDKLNGYNVTSVLNY
ncbi:adenine phosphoribosyltransferase [Lutibacter sp. TH_r2]|uniref:adenine phosphoribosyltransferase n=1 Tax=Lutibacter sp. TH_r2 TaxID=3082083 RepID=UPI00295322D4|nr:adenine phosphoribosyltransferase [Lutibacter sp. TH_r2]MDV7187905.1 adenine phosphoribosyltransferase [Lutibacter sp. TH_r2]